MIPGDYRHPPLPAAGEVMELVAADTNMGPLKGFHIGNVTPFKNLPHKQHQKKAVFSRLPAASRGVNNEII
jgi:hypothetical protein